MTKNLTTTHKAVRADRPVARTRHSRRPEQVRALVDVVRSAARVLVAQKAEERDIALLLVERNFRQIAGASPIAEDLRPWQLLASDLAAALSDVDAVRAERARLLADEIRATVVMIARNPEAELVIRPASRRVLTMLQVHGKEELGVLRGRCGLSATNFSNLLKPLRAHGLITVEDGSDDRRSKIVLLTKKGRGAIEAAAPQPQPAPQTYQPYLERTAPVAAEGAYPLARASE